MIFHFQTELIQFSAGGLGKMPPGKMSPERYPQEKCPQENGPLEICPPGKIHPGKLTPGKLPPSPKKKNFEKLPHAMEYLKGENFVNFNFRQS